MSVPWSRQEKYEIQHAATAGIGGLFAAPIVGAREQGAAGFAKGLATGTARKAAVHICCSQDLAAVTVAPLTQWLF
jgi:hypothetical protein